MNKKYDKMYICNLIEVANNIISEIELNINNPAIIIKKLSEISKILYIIKYKSQAMEDRLKKYKKGIENLGFERKK